MNHRRCDPSTYESPPVRSIVIQLKNESAECGASFFTFISKKCLQYFYVLPIEIGVPWGHSTKKWSMECGLFFVFISKIVYSNSMFYQRKWPFCDVIQLKNDQQKAAHLFYFYIKKLAAVFPCFIGIIFESFQCEFGDVLWMIWECFGDDLGLVW